MSSSNGKTFTGTAIVALALFGLGGAFVEKVRNSGDEPSVVEASQTAAAEMKNSSLAPTMSVGKPKIPPQKPGFEIVNLANDGTGTVAGKATPETIITLDVDGKVEQKGEVSKNGDFSLELETPLGDGKHVLKLKTMDAQGTELTTSDHSIEVNVSKDRAAVVALLEKGKPRQIIQGVEEKPSSEESPKKPEAKPPIVSTPKPEKAAISKPTPEPVKMVADKPETAPVKKVKRRALSFADMKYVQAEGASGEIFISGMAQAGAKLRFFMDDKNIGQAVADKTGAWSLKVKQSLSAGAHWLVAEQIDAKGEVIVKAASPFDRADAPVISSPKKKAFDALAMIKNALTLGQKVEKPTPPAGIKSEAETTTKPDEQAPEKAVSPQNAWDRFAGIFKVDPNKKPDPSSLVTSESKSGADQQIADASRDIMKGKTRSFKPASSQPFAFGSIHYKKTKDGEALELSGHAVPGSRIRLFRGDVGLGDVVANAKGLWSFIQKGKVTSGIHLFRAGHVSKNGRMASEARMQYDHRSSTRMVQLENPGQAVVPQAKKTKDTRQAQLVRKSAELGSPVVRAKDPVKVAKTRVATRSISPIPVTRGLVLRVKRKKASHRALRVAKNKRTQRAKRRKSIKRRAGRPLRTAKAKSKKRKRKIKRTYRSKRKTTVRARRIVRSKPSRRYFLGWKNKSRYMAKRDRYPRSRKTPAKVWVRKGTTLWGYSTHYYGRGHLYPRIQRANRRKIKNPHKIFAGQRIRVPVKRMRRRHRR